MFRTELKPHLSVMKQTSYEMTSNDSFLTVDLNQKFRDGKVWMSSAIP